MDSWKIIFVLTYLLCGTNVSHQSLWPHPQSVSQEERNEENVCQSFDMCATLNGICNYGRCKTQQCASEIYCVCDEGYTGHRCDQRAIAVDPEDPTESKENKPLHEASSSGPLKDLTFTSHVETLTNPEDPTESKENKPLHEASSSGPLKDLTFTSHVETLTTPLPESQIKHNSSLHKITTESSRREHLEAWITTKSSETKTDNASTKLVNDGTSILSNKGISESYDEHNKGDYMKTIATQQSIQNASITAQTVIKDSTTVTIQSSSASIHANSQIYFPTTGDHTIQTTSSPKTVIDGHTVFGKATTVNAVVLNHNSSVVATNAVVDKDNDSFHSQFEKENNTQKIKIAAMQTEQFTTGEKTSMKVVHNKTIKENPHDITNIYTTEKSINSVAAKRRQFGTTVGYFDESSHVRTVESMLPDVQDNTSSLVGPSPEHTPSENNGSGHSNYSENTTANNGVGHSNYSENTTTNSGSGHSNYSENTTENNGSGHSNYSENMTGNNGSGHSKYSENMTGNNGSGHSNYSENTEAKPLNKVVQVQTTERLLTDIYTNESTHLESTTYQPTSRDSDGVDNRSINYSTPKNYLDKRHHIGTTESALTEVNKETSTVVKTTTDQLFTTDSGRVESYSTKIMTIASSDKVDKESFIVNNKTIKEHFSADKSQTFGKSESNNSHAAQIEATVGNTTDTDQNSHYQSTPKDMELGPYIKTIGSTNHESISVTNREKMHFGSTQKLSETIGITEHASNSESNQSLQREQDTYAADSVNEKDISIDLNERNGMTNMQYETMESSEEEQDVIVGGRSVQMPEEVSVQKTSFKLEDIMVQESENSRERPSEWTRTTVRKGYYKRVMSNIFADTLITSDHSQTETTTPATLNDSLLDYMKRTTIKIFEKNITRTKSTKHALDDLISDVSENDSLQQAQEKDIHDHQIVFSTPLDERHDSLNIINGLDSMSKLNLTTTGTGQTTGAVLVTEMFQDLKSPPVSSERLLNKSVVDNKSVIMKIKSQMLQLLQDTKISDRHVSYDNSNIEQKTTSTTLDTTNNPLPQRQIVELNNISSTKGLVGTERAEVFKDNSYKAGRVSIEVKDMPLTSPASKLPTTKSSIPSDVSNNMSPDKSSLLETLRRLLLLEDTFFSPSQIPYTTHSDTESHATTSKASNTYRTLGDVPDIPITTKPITSVSAESNFHTRVQTEEGQKHTTQLKERHLRKERTYRTLEATTTKHEIGNQLSQHTYNNATPNAIEMNDNFPTSSVPVDHQINAKKAINESGSSDGSQHVLTNGSFTG